MKKLTSPSIVFFFLPSPCPDFPFFPSPPFLLKPDSMALDIKTFETIIPSCFLSFTIPNLVQPTHLLRVAVLDSPIQLTESPQIAALLVSQTREPDWIFSTESGHLQLILSSPGISQLILSGNNRINGSDSSPLTYHKRDDAQYVKNLENSLKPLFFALSPKVSVKDAIFDGSVLDDALIHLHWR